MAQTDQPDPSTLLYYAAGRELVTRSTALALAEMIFKDVYGQEDFDTQKPLIVTDGGDRWIIDGNRRPVDHPSLPGQPSKGKVQIVILKANCQIIRLIQKAEFPPADSG